MSDLISRLREAQDGYQDDFRWAFELMSDAADVIERLHAVLDGIVNQSTDHQDAIARAKWRATAKAEAK